MKSFFDMTDEEKKIIVDRAAKESTEEQIRKYGNPTQPPLQGKQDWEESVIKICNPKSSGEQVMCMMLISMFKVVLQSAIHKTEKRMIEAIEKLIDKKTVKTFVRPEDDMVIHMGDVWNEALLSLKKDIIKKLNNHSKQV